MIAARNLSCLPPQDTHLRPQQHQSSCYRSVVMCTSQLTVSQIGFDIPSPGRLHLTRACRPHQARTTSQIKRQSSAHSVCSLTCTPLATRSPQLVPIEIAIKLYPELSIPARHNNMTATSTCRIWKTAQLHKFGTRQNLRGSLRTPSYCIATMSDIHSRLEQDDSGRIIRSCRIRHPSL
jgi:hypothetical protein